MGGNVVVKSKLVFYNLRNKSPVQLWRSLTGPPNDPPIFCYLPPGSCRGLLKLKIRREFSESFEIWPTLTAIGFNGHRNEATKVYQLMRPQGPLVACTYWVPPSEYHQRYPFETCKMSNFDVQTRRQWPCNPYCSVFRRGCKITNHFNLSLFYLSETSFLG